MKLHVGLNSIGRRMRSTHRRPIAAFARRSVFLLMMLVALREPVHAQQAPPRFPVAHDHSSGWCVGFLYVDADSIRFNAAWPESDRNHSFLLKTSDVQQVGRWIRNGQQMNALELRIGQKTYRFWRLNDEQDVINGRPYQFNPSDARNPDSLIATIRDLAPLKSTETPTAQASPQRQQTTATPGARPRLRYEDPGGFYHSAITPPDDYSATQFNASLQVYPFRPFSGDIERQFRTTLLRDWIDPRYQETRVAGQPEFRSGSLPGAQFSMSAKFVDAVVGVPKTRLRWLIVAGNAAALVDMTASDPASWQRALPLLDQFFSSLRVDTETAAPRITQNRGPAARAVAGLYMALVYYQRAFVTSALAAQYYLLSADGRVYRKYDDLAVPGGDPSRFNFDAAERADPVNSGRYSVDGNRVRIQMGSQGSEIITATMLPNGSLQIGSKEYERQ